MEKLKRLGDILYAIDAYDIFESYKLTGASALQFLVFEVGYITNELNFDLDTGLDISKVNEIRNLVNKALPQLLQKKDFTIDVKQSKLTGRVDSYVVKDNKNKDTYMLNFNYLNRVHVLNPEYFARKDKYFDDLHIYALSNLENYARYFVELLEDKYNTKILDNILSSNKLLPQQFPFIRKLVAFYVSTSENRANIKLDSMDIRLKDILSFTDNELKYLEETKNGNFNLDLILPPTIASKLQNHPKIKIMRQEK